MIHHIISIFVIIAGLAAGSAMVYYGLSLWSAVRFLREAKTAGHASRPTVPSQPPVSILKPLKGTDPQMYEAFRSHCRQEYPEYEILFGVSERSDPAIDLVERLKREFPQQ